MNRTALTAIAVVLLIAATAAVASPLLSLQGLRDALSARNSEALSGLVDADRLRRIQQRRHEKIRGRGVVDGGIGHGCVPEDELVIASGGNSGEA